MTRPKNLQRMEKEARVQEALETVVSSQHTCSSASVAFNVPHQTLYDRMNGKPPRHLAQEKQQVLSNAEEKELVQWITRLTITAYPPRHKTLLEMAEEIRKRRVREINNQIGINIEYHPIEKDWVPRFLRRHSELACVITRKIDASRVKAATPEAIAKFFEDLSNVIKEYNITPENEYNMDESGYAMGKIEASKCIINSRIRQQLQAKPGRQEWVSTVECICADGSSIPPLVIFKAENLNYQWIPASIADDWRFSCNTKGWTSNEHGLQWLMRIFEPATREKANGGYRLLICDGHDSHITGDFVGHCMDNKIVLVILPPHTSHLTQPLDVGVFGPLKKAMASELAPLIGTGIARLLKVEWLTAFVQAHTRVFNPENISGGFCGAGIFPLDSSKVHGRIPQLSQSSTHDSEKRESTSQTDNNVFNSSVLTSSPNNSNATSIANTALLAQANFGHPLSTPAGAYLGCLVHTSDRRKAANTIYQKENKDMREALGRRKIVKSDKRQIVKGKHVMTTPEMRQALEEWERNKKKSKATGPKREKKKVQASREQSNEESESDWDEGIGAEAEMLDCIEVEV